MHALGFFIVDSILLIVNATLYSAYIWLSSIVFFSMLGYLIYKYVLSLINRPMFQKGSIVYQDWFASGYSMWSILTRLGRAHGVLRLVVTNDLLWVTSWFPFSLLGPFYDMEHAIPLAQITNIERRQRFRSVELQLSYIDKNGVIHILRLTPNDENEFLKALKQKPLD